VNQALPTGDERGDTVDADSRDRSVLEEEREFFLRSLEDLEAERVAGDIDEVDYQALKDDYTVRAAQVLRRLAYLDGGGPHPDELLATPAPQIRYEPESTDEVEDGEAPVPSPWRKRILIGVAAVLILGGITWAVAGFAGVRLPGEQVSGSNSTQQATQDVVGAETAEANGSPTEALKDYQAALRLDPGNVEALTGEGAILVTVGASGGGKSLVTEGITDLAKAELADPNYGIAYAYRGLGYYYFGQYSVAVQQLKTYVADTPAKSRESSIVAYLAKAEAKVKTAQ
jgi:tetratricopeptide (TPR) repeat protein